MVGDADAVGQRLVDLEPHVRREGEQSDRQDGKSGDPHPHREGAGRPDVHAAAQQPGLELHLLARNRADVRHDDREQRARPIAALRGGQPVPDEHGGGHGRPPRRAGLVHDVPDRQLRGHGRHADQPARGAERLQVEEQRAPQPLPARCRGQRVRQPLRDHDHEQPGHVRGTHGRLGRLVPQLESGPVLPLPDDERHSADLRYRPGLGDLAEPREEEQKHHDGSGPDARDVLHVQGVGRRALLERDDQGADRQRHDLHRRQRPDPERLGEHLHRVGHDLRLGDAPDQELEDVPGRQ